MNRRSFFRRISAGALGLGALAILGREQPVRNPVWGMTQTFTNTDQWLIYSPGSTFTTTTTSHAGVYYWRWIFTDPAEPIRDKLNMQDEEL